jgi:hypothetical protein
MCKCPNCKSTNVVSSYPIYLHSGNIFELSVSDSKTKNDFLPSNVKSVVMHDGITIVNFKDGSKGIAKQNSKDVYDPYLGFVIAYYKGQHNKSFDLKLALEGCLENAKKKGYKQAILKNY